MGLFPTNVTDTQLTLYRKEIFMQMQREKSTANDIDPSENVELKQYHLGRASILEELLYNTNSLNHKKLIHQEKFSCYEVHRPNIPDNGCVTQCNQCKIIENERTTTQQ